MERAARAGALAAAVVACLAIAIHNTRPNYNTLDVQESGANPIDADERLPAMMVKPQRPPPPASSSSSSSSDPPPPATPPPPLAAGPPTPNPSPSSSAPTSSTTPATTTTPTLAPTAGQDAAAAAVAGTTARWPAPSDARTLTLGAGGGLTVVGSIAHDPQAFTEGYIHAVRGGRAVLYESVGLTGRSSVRRVDPATGATLQTRQLPNARHFGEGIALVGDLLFMLTWKSRTGYVFDADTLAPVRTFRYKTTNGEGWGMTTVPAAVVGGGGQSSEPPPQHGGDGIAATDGSANIIFWRVAPDVNGAAADAVLVRARTVEVRDPAAGRRPVRRLNELEYVPATGELLANVWYEDRIARVDPRSGLVRGWLDFRGARRDQFGGTPDVARARPPVVPLKQRVGREEVLNGIAVDARSGTLLLTGKLWRKSFYVKVDVGGPNAAAEGGGER